MRPGEDTLDRDAATDKSSPLVVGPQTMPTDESGWWETERAAFIRSRIVDLTTSGDRIVDVGCGRGTMLDDSSLADRQCIGVDGHIWPEWRSSSRLFLCAAADALPFRDGAFDLVGSFDVLEHLDDDDAGIIEQRRILRRHGHMVTAVPADPRLWSAHDDAVGHKRRYTRASFLTLATRCGLTPQGSSYFFSFLWLPARLLRGSKLRRDEHGATTGVLGRLVRKAIGALCAAERWFIARRPLAFGSSLWIESVRSDAPDAT